MLRELHLILVAQPLVTSGRTLSSPASPQGKPWWDRLSVKGQRRKFKSQNWVL